MKIALIVAMDRNRGIGKNNDLLWHLPADMKFFKETTSSHVVVMGRKNYESIPERFRPLPNRENAVLSRNENYEAPGCQVFTSLNLCLEHYQNSDKTIFIIGGGQIYKEALEKIDLDEMFITEVDVELEADTFFPEVDESAWTKSVILTQDKNEKNIYSFQVYHFQKK